MKMIFIIGWLMVPFSSMANPVIFNKTFGGTANDFAHAIVQTAEGGYIVCGQTDSFGFGSDLKPDMWIVKTDKKGDKEWDKTYGGRESDIAFAIQQTADKGYVVAGTTSSFGKGYPAIWILKLDAKGDSLWSVRIEGSVVSTARSIVQTSDGGYVIAGSGKENIIKLNGNGQREWGRKYGWVCYAIEQTEDGGYIAAGDTIFRPQEWDYIPALTLFKLDREGYKEWSNPLGAKFLGIGSSVQQTTDGGYIFAGDSIAEKSPYDHSHYALAVKLDKEGKVVWKHAGPEHSSTQSICETANGNYAATGNVLDENHGLNVLICLLDQNGGEKWRKSYGSITQWEYGSSIRQATDMGFIVAGQTESAGAGRYDLWLLKLDENGNLIPTGIPDPACNGNENQLRVKNFPNPIGLCTTLTFYLPEPEFVTLRVFDPSGKILETKNCGFFAAGESVIVWKRQNLPGGVYAFRIETSKMASSLKFILASSAD